MAGIQDTYVNLLEQTGSSLTTAIGRKELICFITKENKNLQYLSNLFFFLWQVLKGICRGRGEEKSCRYP